MPTLVSPVGDKVESLEKQLERIDKEIAAVERKKLITIVSRGGPDAVLYVQPYDLRGKDPEEDVPVIESYVLETKWDNGFAQHITGKRDSGRTEKRGPMGPFGPTYKIDTGNQNGEREYAEFNRVLETHCNRLTKVPKPAPYHSEVNELGHMDLRNISLKKEDVPTAILENYEPLLRLKSQREAIAKAMGDPQKEVDGSEPKNADVYCTSCDFKSKSEHGLRLHIAKSHKGE